MDLMVDFTFFCFQVQQKTSCFWNVRVIISDRNMIYHPIVFMIFYWNISWWSSVYWNISCWSISINTDSIRTSDRINMDITDQTQRKNLEAYGASLMLQKEESGAKVGVFAGNLTHNKMRPVNSHDGSMYVCHINVDPHLPSILTPVSINLPLTYGSVMGLFNILTFGGFLQWMVYFREIIPSFEMDDVDWGYPVMTKRKPPFFEKQKLTSNRILRFILNHGCVAQILPWDFTGF